LTDILETMKAELDEGASLLRRHYPDDDEQQLLDRARSWLQRRYQLGRWPEEEMTKRKAEEEAGKAAFEV
jgi:hypothetical protein